MVDNYNRLEIRMYFAEKRSEQFSWVDSNINMINISKILKYEAPGTETIVEYTKIKKRNVIERPIIMKHRKRL